MVGQRQTAVTVGQKQTALELPEVVRKRIVGQVAVEQTPTAQLAAGRMRTSLPAEQKLTVVAARMLIVLSEAGQMQIGELIGVARTQRAAEVVDQRQKAVRMWM